MFELDCSIRLDRFQNKNLQGLKVNNKEKIWQVVHQIPKGKVASYGQVAKMADLPGYARYVGYVLKNLPEDSKLPWFRVVNSQGKISFPIGTRQHLAQKSRLEEEGIVFVSGKFSMKMYQW
ncbi:MAG: MGMT family protein [Gammaproteobacteria bacterium]|jgi:methylated-DNA-protein-cysteine methyltransferase-like protein|nr:MGMT family protein [Gammaproteobacteria bacterium]MBT3859988.1 MGMT family protein [Gammaproteobacteria bacterium]MBT3986450.1 MGMT family protein [Gammaproteobacteria bacterium]MBT4255263.1 MGMT family protein [Gammaproteobacteria bacterium]MBT4580839.1 MGMT family protein [Gammaproteobacteria bacterium]